MSIMLRRDLRIIYDGRKKMGLATLTTVIDYDIPVLQHERGVRS